MNLYILQQASLLAMANHQAYKKEYIRKFEYLDIGIRPFSDINRMLKVLYNGHIICNFKTFSASNVAHKVPIRFWKIMYLLNIVVNNNTSELVSVYSNLKVGDSSALRDVSVQLLVHKEYDS